MNVLLITLDQFRGDCLSAAGHPVVRTPSLDRLASEGVLLCPPLQPGGAVRPRPGLPLHGHVPVQQPGGRERHAARRPVRQHGRAAHAVPGYVPDDLRIRRPGSGPSTRSGRVTVACRTIRASRRGSRWRSTFPTSSTPGRLAWPSWVTAVHGRRWLRSRPNPSGRPSTASLRS